MQKRKRELAEIPREPDPITELERQLDGFLQKSPGITDSSIRDRDVRERAQRACSPPAPADLSGQLGALLEQCQSLTAITRLECDRAEQR
jgi:hypothetical protein